MKEVPIISQTTFWDVEISEIDWEENSEWVIHRVFDRGSLDEVLSVDDYYGSSFVKKTMKNTKTFLPNHSILLAMAIFKLKFKDFKCLEKRPFRMSY